MNGCSLLTAMEFHDRGVAMEICSGSGAVEIHNNGKVNNCS